MHPTPRIRSLVFSLIVAALVLCASIGWAGPAKNIILMIGDGMSYEQVKAGSYYLTGAAGNLSFEPYYKCGVTTYSANSSVTDSAAAATALATGYKVNNGVISQSSTGNPYQTILEKAKALGKRTGLLTTVPITHATPAAFGAHEASRNNYINIGDDYLNSSRPEMIFGGGDPARGGSSYFSSSQVTTAQSLGYQVAYDYSQMSAWDPASVNRALGLFGGTYLTYEYDRQPSNTEPHLSQMTAKALAIANSDPDGFFLMIEGGNIDPAAHANHIERTTREVVEFNNSVQTVLTWMQGRTDTLLIITGDHETGGLTVTNQGTGNYPTATWTTTGHTATNAALYITGSNANLIDSYIQGGVADNTDVFKVMDAALTIPEPSTALALACGLGGWAGIIWRMKK
ncbi:MAG TPA: alkaline phosphatase [Armatimonadota bacterium]|nr:alkaline phosphatase [Armatimonadota bacterium]